MRDGTPHTAAAAGAERVPRLPRLQSRRRTSTASWSSCREGRRALAGALLCAAPCSRGRASAQYRLRADAYFAAADSSTGLLVLTGESRQPSWLTAETVVWLGTGRPPGRRDGRLRARAATPTATWRRALGRMLVTAGAIRPVHIDGIDVTARAPWGTSVEVFGGMPVVSDFQPRDYDWAVGGRAGAARRATWPRWASRTCRCAQTGAVAYEELGVDGAVQATRWLDAAVHRRRRSRRRSTLSRRARSRWRRASRRLRFELFALRRSPSHLLPATSLFSALGDIPSERAGGSVLWRAAPRLDVLGEGAVESLGGEVGAPGALLRTTLRLDDHGRRRARAGGCAGRARRAPRGRASAARRASRSRRRFAASTEVELVAPDDPRGRGAVWPWGLVALRFRPEPRWEMASAVEASASPTAVSSVSGLFRVSYVWGTK